MFKCTFVWRSTQTSEDSTVQTTETPALKRTGLESSSPSSLPESFFNSLDEVLGEEEQLQLALSISTQEYEEKGKAKAILADEDHFQLALAISLFYQ